MENIRFTLNAAMQQALDNKLISDNYIANVKIKKATKKETMILSPDEEKRLISVCNKYKNISAFGIVMALRLGLQLGELLALKWSDVDLTEKKIHVRQSLNRQIDDDAADIKSALLFTDLKTTRTLFEYDLTYDFILDVELYRNKQNEFFGSLPDIVIASENGRPVAPGNYNKFFKRLLDKSGIAHTNFDVLRNTFAVRYLEKGYEPTELLRILGYAESSRALSKFNGINKRQTSNVL